MIKLGYSDNKHKSAYVAIQVTWHQFEKIRVIAGNMFIKTLKFYSLANGAKDTEFEYCVSIERKDGKAITKQQLHDATLVVDAIINTLKSF